MNALPTDPNVVQLLGDQSLPAEGAAVVGRVRASPAHPWVPVPPRVRYLLLAILLAYTLACVVGALANTAQNPASPLLAASTFIYLAAVAFPLISFDRERHGWFHPLVFSTLMLMARSLPRRAGLGVLLVKLRIQGGVVIHFELAIELALAGAGQHFFQQRL